MPTGTGRGDEWETRAERLLISLRTTTDQLEHLIAEEKERRRRRRLTHPGEMENVDTGG